MNQPNPTDNEHRSTEGESRDLQATDGSTFTVAEYQQYLKSDHWANFKVEARMKLPYRCALCGDRGTRKPLHLHHRTYRNLGAESLDDVLYLCPWCHKKAHRVPAKVGFLKLSDLSTSA
jgi:5-methylcytosine-specific restriction endonuclease McrA